MNSTNYLPIKKLVLFIALSGFSSASSHGEIPIGRPISSQLQGIIVPWRVVNVACAESGLLEELLVRPGDAIEQGQALARLESAQQELAIEVARAQASATGRIQMSQAEVKLNKQRVSAIERGRRGDYTTQSELDRAQADLDISIARLTMERDEQLVQQLQLKRMEKQLEQRTIFAPYTGSVQKIHKQQGEFVAPTSPEIMEIVDTSKLRAVFYVTLSELGKLAVGQSIEVNLEGLTGMTAEVEFIAPMADAGSGLIEIRALIDNPTRAVQGSSCIIVLPGKAADSI